MNRWFTALLIVMSILAIYNSVVTLIVDEIRNKKNAKSQTESQPKEGMSFTARLQLFSAVIFLTLLVALLFFRTKFIVTLFVGPGVVLQIFSILYASSIVVKIVLSNGNEGLSSDEDNSLNFIALLGVIVGCLFFDRMENYRIPNSVGKALGCSLLLVFVYSIYLFFVATLSVRPLKDLSNIFLGCANKIRGSYDKLDRWLTNKVELKRKIISCSECILLYIQETTRQKKVIIGFAFGVAIIIDVVFDIIRYSLAIFLWLPISAITTIIRKIGAVFVKTASAICQLSKRRVAAISFRFATVVAVLIVVVESQIYSSADSSAFLPILEFLASVIIFPILFEWICEIFQKK